MKRIATQGTTARIAALEPPKQAAPMETVAAGAAALGGQLAVGRDNAVADRALGLTLEHGGDVAAPGDQAVDEGAPAATAAGASAAAGVGEVDDALGGDEPAAPFLLVDGDAVLGLDGGARERVGWGQADGDRHCLLVDRDAGGEFARGEGDFDLEGLVVCGGLGEGPFVDGVELRGDY